MEVAKTRYNLHHTTKSGAPFWRKFNSLGIRLAQTCRLAGRIQIGGGAKFGGAKRGEPSQTIANHRPGIFGRAGGRLALCIVREFARRRLDCSRGAPFICIGNEVGGGGGGAPSGRAGGQPKRRPASPRGSWPAWPQKERAKVTNNCAQRGEWKRMHLSGCASGLRARARGDVSHQSGGRKRSFQIPISAASGWRAHLPANYGAAGCQAWRSPCFARSIDFAHAPPARRKWRWMPPNSAKVSLPLARQ